ncbi:MAG: hypothetical protein SO022_06480 [Selenomonadaceae bacterium]|nr:hypothetical protein [Selenomonadaceae bacterium]
MMGEYEEKEMVTLAINHISNRYKQKISSELTKNIAYYIYAKKNIKLRELLSDYEVMEKLINNALLQENEKKALRLLIIQRNIVVMIEKIVMKL